MHRLSLLCGVALAISPSALHAQIQVPNLPEVSTDPGTFEYTGVVYPFFHDPQAMQSFYSAANFSAITEPTGLLGVQMRLARDQNWKLQGASGVSWPPSAITFSNYEIIISKASAAITSQGQIRSSEYNFTQNMLDSVVVRTGPLTIPANAFSTSGESGIHPFGPVLNFSIPYIYNPGDSLLFTIRHSGFTTQGVVPSAAFAGAPFTPGLTDGIWDDGSSFTTALGFTESLHAQFVVPAPGAAGLLGLAGATLLTRRRR